MSVPHEYGTTSVRRAMTGGGRQAVAAVTVAVVAGAGGGVAGGGTGSVIIWGAVGGVTGWLLAWWLRRPFVEIAAATTEKSAATPGRRLPVDWPDADAERLAGEINRIFRQAELGVDQARRFSTDAAHELKTPLTILLGHLQTARSETVAESPEDLRLAMLVEEVQRLLELVKGLLFFARLDAGLQRLPTKTVDLSRVLAGMCEDLPIIAHGLKVETSVATALATTGSAQLIQQCLQNLISNAIKYNCQDGFIRVAAGREGDRVKVRISNSGPGVPEDDQARVFDRFFRADESRSRSNVEGHGIGLSLAKEIAVAHGGDLLLEHADAAETRFCLMLPAA